MNKRGTELIEDERNPAMIEIDAFRVAQLRS